LRRRRSFLLLACVGALVFGAGPASGASGAQRASVGNSDPAAALWNHYPLEPLPRPPATRSAGSVRFPDATAPSSSDSTLLIGGLALVILILTDTAFLTLSARVLRESR
jgi:hypothetical protein